MIVDSSVLVAIVLGEDDASSFATVLASAGERIAISAATWVEASIVVEARQGADAARDLGLLVEHLGATVEPVDEMQAHAAVTAWRRFGKGRHPAGLNLGDCFSYALAIANGEALLFKGNDFTQTDVRVAL